MDQARTNNTNRFRPRRHRRLLEILSAEGQVRTEQIASALNVSTETIRSDFAELEARGALQRAHGGAVCLDYHKRFARASAATHAIARSAIGWIQPGQNIFLDSSPAIHHLARFISDQPLTVLTPSLEIPHLFSEKPAVRVIVLGGKFRATSKSCAGYPAEIISDLYRIDAAFISCQGIDTRDGLSEAAEDQAFLKRRLLTRVSQLYLLADSSKANTSGPHYFAKNSQVDIWFTETEPDGPLVAELRAQGVKIEVCPVDGHLHSAQWRTG